MNRRNFFQSIAKTIATVAVAQQLVKSWCVDRLAASAPLTTVTKRVNPEWEKAPYEMGFIYTGVGLQSFYHKREEMTKEEAALRVKQSLNLGKGSDLLWEKYPIRYDLQGNMIQPIIIMDAPNITNNEISDIFNGNDKDDFKF